MHHKEINLKGEYSEQPEVVVYVQSSAFQLIYVQVVNFHFQILKHTCVYTVILSTDCNLARFYFARDSELDIHVIVNLYFGCPYVNMYVKLSTAEPPPNPQPTTLFELQLVTCTSIKIVLTNTFSHNCVLLLCTYRLRASRP